ncbi:hypothetical protein [Macrococcoides canis]|uniref:hypothetical protein n=1 Tax=Macrococcoides canis TaxID=1855823 RepID=UPI001B8BB2B2|nr:hypothetical protein [Macrococcus canis]QUR94351.1 hypothetical protein GOY09_05005 [Macrococcus canis]
MIEIGSFNNTSIIKGYQKSVRDCLENENYFGAILTSLILPEVCSKISYCNSKGVSTRYKEWLNTYFIPLIEDEDETVRNYLNAKNIYALRCTIVHEGTSDVSRQDNYMSKLKAHEQVDELIPYLNTLDFHKVLYANSTNVSTREVKRSLFLDLEFFCELMIKSVDIWLKDNINLDETELSLFSIAYILKDKEDEKFLIFRK